MGSDYSTQRRQNTYKICMSCNDNKLLNEDLMILNIMTYADLKDKSQLLLRCSKGHILIYENSEDHINWCEKQIIENNEMRKKVLQTNKNDDEINKLKTEILSLKQEIKELRESRQN